MYNDHRAIETILAPLVDGVPSARAARLMADAAATRGDALAARMWADQALAAPRDGVIATIAIAAGDQVSEGVVLLELAEEEG